MENVKIGDWYVDTTHSEPREPMLMTKDKLAYAKTYPNNYRSHLQPWVPKVAEWCWISIANWFEEDQHVEELSIVVQVVDDLYPVLLDACQPFSGKVPTWNF